MAIRRKSLDIKRSPLGGGLLELLDEVGSHQNVPDRLVALEIPVPYPEGPVGNLVLIGQGDEVSLPALQFEYLYPLGGGGSGVVLVLELYLGLQVSPVESNPQSGEAVQVVEFPGGELFNGEISDGHFLFLLMVW